MKLRQSGDGQDVVRHGPQAEASGGNFASFNATSKAPTNRATMNAPTPVPASKCQKKPPRRRRLRTRPGNKAGGEDALALPRGGRSSCWPRMGAKEAEGEDQHTRHHQPRRVFVGHAMPARASSTNGASTAAAAGGRPVGDLGRAVMPERYTTDSKPATAWLARRGGNGADSRCS